MVIFKRIGILFCFTSILLLTAACSPENIEDAMREAKSTDLFNESIDDIKLGMSIADEALITKHGNFELSPWNEEYTSQRNYDQYWNEQIIMSIDRETKEILQIGVLENNNTSSTKKGIRLGVPIDEVISAYGENYFVYNDREQTIYIIGYVDHQNNLELSFSHFDGEVQGISLGYAFDRMKWEQQ
ncbi:hypothetical protein [Halalkalibacter lacteus]|uniref:hypothetical protein n=1 Tax=Halalkalibacter lacteus TaxID=3090663 RepID=UPI002FC871FE